VFRAFTWIRIPRKGRGSGGVIKGKKNKKDCFEGDVIEKIPPGLSGLPDNKKRQQQQRRRKRGIGNREVGKRNLEQSFRIADFYAQPSGPMDCLQLAKRVSERRK